MEHPNNKTVIIENINSRSGKVNINGTFKEMPIHNLLEFVIKIRAKQVLESFPDLFVGEMEYMNICIEIIRDTGFKYFIDTRRAKEIFINSFL